MKLNAYPYALEATFRAREMRDEGTPIQAAAYLATVRNVLHAQGIDPVAVTDVMQLAEMEVAGIVEHADGGS